MNKKEKTKLIDDCTMRIQSLLNELEGKLEDSITSCEFYHGDIISGGVESEGHKIILSTEEKDSELDFDSIGYEMTAQEIIQEFHNLEYSLKVNMSKGVGLPHISDKYLNILKLEKEEARKALGEENKEYHKLL